MRLSSQDRWKYSTIGLLAVLAVGFSFPQASAHITNNVQHVLAHAVELLTGIQSDVDDIQGDLDGLQPKSLGFNIQEDLAPFGIGGNSIQQPLIAVEEGKTFSGHVSIGLLTGENVLVRLFCEVPNGSAIIFDQTGFGEDVNVAFACTGLHLTVINQDDEDHFVTASGIVQYQTSTDVSDELPA
jgi:hypothetical protein